MFIRFALLLGAIAALSCSQVAPGRGGGGGGQPASSDLAITFADDMSVAECDKDRPCPMGRRCDNGSCVDAGPPCKIDDECQDDTYCACLGGGGGDAGPCVDGECRPWNSAPSPFDPDCAGQAFLATDFKAPAIKCRWKAPMGTSNVIMTPIVVDLDRDRKPEIVFATYSNQMLYAIRGDNCQEVWKQNLPLSGRAQLAAADLDNDGSPEIVVPGSQDVLVLDSKGNIVSRAGMVGGGFPSGTCGGAAIADVDADGVPEIAVHGTLYRYRNKQLTEVWTKPATGGHWGVMTAMADMDGDGKPEVVTGLEVYDGVTGADQTPASLRALGPGGGYPAIADFNKDGKPDIVLVQSRPGQQKVSIVDFANDKVIFGPYTVAGGGWGGTPTVGDYDGDGVPDVGLASNTNYYLYALKCARMPKPKECTGVDPGVLWQRTTKDVSSGGTGSSTFDFNGDGKNEVVYRDECWLRVYSGADGKSMFAQPITSGTLLEYPVIADVDADGHADIVVPSDSLSNCVNVPEGQLNVPWQGPTDGIYIFQDPMNRWMPSRPLWHQHTYHITEIGDDLKVPKLEKPNWQSWNNYRKNIQGNAVRPGALPDFTGGQTIPLDNGGRDCDVSIRLWANVCNRGANTADAGAPGTFYTSDPRKPGATAICTARTARALAPGDCESVSCDREMPPPGKQDLWFRADDDGKQENLILECKKNNNVLFLPEYVCPTIG